MNKMLLTLTVMLLCTPLLAQPAIWPDGVEYPLGIKRYEPAKNTQSIFRYTGSDAPQIRKVARTDLERKWQIPGGMDTVTGWHSDLYIVPVPGTKQYGAYIPVLNSHGYFQNEYGYSRQYADGTRFFDVLSNKETGKVFELRERRKVDGMWANHVIYRDVDQRPIGYTGLKVGCNSCHKQAGTGGYGVGLVPGGDTVISDPFTDLE